METILFISYLLFDYILEEKRQFDKTKKLLKENPFILGRKKKLEELAEWHFQNCMCAIKQKGVPKPVSDWVLGYRKTEPSLKEIQEWYGQKREYFAKKHKEWERKAILITVPITILLILGLAILIL